MVTMRRGTFETNSSSTHSFSIEKHSQAWEDIRDIFDDILDRLPNIYDEEDAYNILVKLHDVESIIIRGN